MAKAPKSKSDTPKIQIKIKPSFFQDERVRVTIGIVLAVISLYLTLAIVSFFFAGAADQSKLDMSYSEFMNVDVLVSNWTGKMGAFVANLLVNRGFGIAVILPVLFIAVCAMNLLNFKIISISKAFNWTLVGTIWFSLFFGFFFISGYEDTSIYLGGVHGYFISLWITAVIGNVGMVGVLIITLFLFFLFAVDNSVELLRKWKRALVEYLKSSKKAALSVDEMLEGDIEPLSALDEIKASEFAGDDEDNAPFNDDFSIDEEFEEDINAPTQYMPLDIEETFDEEILEEPELSNAEDGIGLDIVESVEEDLVKRSVRVEDLEDYDPTLDLPHFKLPPLNLLVDHKVEVKINEEILIENKNRIVDSLKDFGIEIASIKATVGPTITLYEIVPAAGVRISKIKNLEDDIALSLAALGIRIIAPIPGKGTIGIEVPNHDPEIVSMHSVIASKKFQEEKMELPIALGKTITNETFCIDLVKMPHMLVAGATGQGKSVGINAIITSLLYKKHPAQLKFVFVDPKKVELSIYSKIEKHYLAKLPDEDDAIITDVNKVVATLNSLTVEMDQRYDLLKEATARNIKEYNAKFVKRQLNPEKGHRYLPYIVVVVDEFADLIMTAGKEVEMPIARIAQLARAIGIHMILATQRPSTNIITGIIKANFPARVAFKVASMIDSRTILDASGANRLIGKGDMLISSDGKMTRVQCAFVDTPEVEAIVEFIGEQKGYPSALLLPEYTTEDNNDFENTGDILAQRDSLFEEAARMIVLNQSGSTSLLQRRMGIGYNRAGRIIDQIEAAGIIGPFEGSKARKVLISDEVSLDEHLRHLDLNA